MTDPVAARLDAAQEVAAEAGRLALDFFAHRESLAIEAKASPQDIVSRADREVETLIRDRLAAAFPEDGFLGEEHGAQEGSSGFTWVIDPIDGTSPFLAGLPHWCVVLALVRDGETVAGVIEHPLAQETFTARRGHGAHLNGQRLTARPDLRISNCNVALGASHRTSPDFASALVRELMRRGGIFYRNGSGAIMLASVAAGRLGGYYEPHMHPWDCLAALLMVEEAGGRSAPFPKCPGGGMVLVAAPNVWDELQAVVKAAEGQAG
ncbi:MULTISPECIES: inositol monophosphatase family protein [Rhodobacterales]|uniref:inositol monophosphatase family protein n=1 Tax=Rhodobacterales TaxID=204455 RepID=UPI000BBE5C3A|nr:MULTISPECIES: inositol monophosphatase family protein [Paracoccaceae]MCE6949871.1 inositol monophosphatase family protein [Cereibacter sphaeroides]MCE6967395.1 inositol monophosphatase family protein [Cereibacter sphaeroides]